MQIKARQPPHGANAAAIRDFAQQCLPNSHVPSQLLELDKLPLSRNGKFDRIQAREELVRSMTQTVSSPQLASASVTQNNEKPNNAKTTLTTSEFGSIIEAYEQVMGKHLEGFSEESAFLSLGLKPSHLKGVAEQLSKTFERKVFTRKLIKCRHAKEVADEIL